MLLEEEGPITLKAAGSEVRAKNLTCFDLQDSIRLYLPLGVRRTLLLHPVLTLYFLENRVGGEG